MSSQRSIKSFFQPKVGTKRPSTDGNQAVKADEDSENESPNKAKVMANRGESDPDGDTPTPKKPKMDEGSSTYSQTLHQIIQYTHDI